MHRSAVYSAAFGLTLWLGAVLCVAWPSRAGAHQSAISQVSLRTQPTQLAVGFQFDATSVVDLMHRTSAELQEVDKESLGPHGGVLLKYVAARFRVSNDGASCALVSPDPVPTLWLTPRSRKVPLSMVFECAAELGALTIDSELWRDEDTPHKIIATVRHDRAVERFFLDKSKRQLHVELAKLQQPQISGAEEPADGIDATPGDSAPAERAPRATFAEFVKQGVVHIFGGLDHVLFVLCLVLAARSWRELAFIVTSFTVAHSITIGLTAFELVRVAPIVVEPIIAASIVYVAIENIVRKEPRNRVGVTFGFGLVHGLGFGGVLLDLGIAGGDVVPLLLGFNIGVELGQLAIVIPLFALVVYAQKAQMRRYAPVRTATCVLVALAGSFWVVERLAGA